MVVIRPPVWISILFTFIECVQVEEISVTACSGREYTCSNFKINCTVQHIRIIGAEYRYNKKGNCYPDSCLNSKVCCSADNNDCRANYTDDQLKDLLRDCDGKNWCGPMPSPPTPTLDHIRGCTGYKYPGFIHLTYTCIPPGTDTSGNKSSSSGKSEDGISVPAIIGVVIAVIIVIAVVAVALIIYKRRQKKSTKDDTRISNLPKGMTNHVYERPVESGKSSEVVETSNYDVISDESVLNYSMPEKNKKDNTNIPVTVDKFSDVSAEEYDKIEFKMTGANKASNYDHLAALKGKIGDDPYSHVSNRSKSVTTATPTVNDYSLCKPNSKDTLRNDDDYSHADLERDCCKPNSKDTLRNDDDYSHADLARDCCKPNSKDTLRNDDDYSHADRTIKPESDIGEEDSYNHIDFDNTKHTMQNGTAVNGVARSESKTNSTTCTAVKPRDMVNKNLLLK